MNQNLQISADFASTKTTKQNWIKSIYNYFQDDVDEFMSRGENESVEAVLKRLDEQHNKYKFMEYNLTTKKNRWVHVY